MLKISVVIPSYNQGEYLEETILSIINQGYPNLEIMLIDGNSTDNSLSIIKKYSHHFKYWVSEKDSGQSEAINKGLSRCTGDIATWLCSDDLFTPGALHKVNQLFTELPDDVGLIHGSSIIFSGSKIIRINKGNVDDSLENILSGMTFPQPSAFFRRALLDKTGLLDQKLHYGMDYDLFSKFAIITKFQVVDHVLSKYRLHPESKSVSAVSKFIDDWSKVFTGIAEAGKFNSLIKVFGDLDIKTERNDSTFQFFNKYFNPENINQQKLLYKFLCFVLRYDYESERFSRAKLISKYLDLHFKNLLILEPEINTIVWRSNLPPSAIKIARKISRALFYRSSQNYDRTFLQVKIGFITSHINQSTQWNWFSDELLKRGVPHIHIIINETYPLLADDLKKMGVKVYYLPHKHFFYFFINFIKVCYILKKNKINLVHTELPYGNLVGLISSWFCGIKMRVSTCGNTTWAFDYNNKKQKLIDKITYRLSKKVIALTEEAKAFLIKYYHIPESKLTIIHHSLKSDEYLFKDEFRVEKLKKDLNIEPGTFIIGMVARFEFWKGHIFAIEAFRKLLMEYPNVRMLIFGSKGESFNSVIRYIQNYDLQDHIMYKGFVSDNIALFRLFDVHVHIPIKAESETFGINIMEGMISGCAQILTLSGISCFTARDEENCLVVPYSNTDAVYHALKRLYDQPDLRKKLGEKAREDALKYFQYSDKVQLHIELYEELRKEITK